MEELKQQYDEKLAMKEDLRRKAELTEIKLDRAGKLVSGLAGERDRWEKSVQVRWYLDSPKTQNISIYQISHVSHAFSDSRREHRVSYRRLSVGRRVPVICWSFLVQL